MILSLTCLLGWELGCLHAYSFEFNQYSEISRTWSTVYLSTKYMGTLLYIIQLLLDEVQQQTPKKSTVTAMFTIDPN